jgi:hypothetical protein
MFSFVRQGARLLPSRSTTDASHLFQSAIDLQAMEIDSNPAPGNPVEAKPTQQTDAMDIDNDASSQSTVAKESGVLVGEDVEMSG